MLLVLRALPTEALLRSPPDILTQEVYILLKFCRQEIKAERLLQGKDRTEKATAMVARSEVEWLSETCWLLRDKLLIQVGDQARIAICSGL